MSDHRPYERLRFFCGCALACVAMIRAEVPPATNVGIVLAAKVTGTATVTADGSTTALKQDSKLPSTGTVRTANDSTTVLVFSNGITLQLGANTELVLQKFHQDPFAGNFPVAGLKEEPSKSRTMLVLNRGEIIPKVKKLKAGSSFAVQTPVGAADADEGTFRITFRPTGDGTSFAFKLSALDREVRFRHSVPGSTDKAVVVPPGQEISIRARVTIDGKVVVEGN